MPPDVSLAFNALELVHIKFPSLITERLIARGIPMAGELPEDGVRFGTLVKRTVAMTDTLVFEWTNDGSGSRCDKCGAWVQMQDVGYMGPVDRSDTSCSPFTPFETVCAKCEGSAVS